MQAINRRRRNITSAFAFVHRAYHRDEKLERMEEDGRGEEEEMGVASGEGVLLSLSGVCVHMSVCRRVAMQFIVTDLLISQA